MLVAFMAALVVAIAFMAASEAAAAFTAVLGVAAFTATLEAAADIMVLDIEAVDIMRAIGVIIEDMDLMDVELLEVI
jgi:hypothetical protein